MIEEKGVVLAVRGDQARVQVQARSACGHCQARAGCGTSLLEGLLGRRAGDFWVKDPVGVRPGDQVVIGIAEAELRRASLLLYFLPIVALVGGGVAGQGLGPSGSEWPAIVGGLVGLGLALGWVSRWSKRHRQPARILRLGQPPAVGLTVEVET